MPARFNPKKAKRSLNYIVEVQKKMMKLNKRVINTKNLKAAADIAAAMRIPNARFKESLREQGINRTLQQVKALKKLSLMLGIPNAEIAKMLKTRKLKQVFEELMEKAQEQQQGQAMAA
ncbi:MAG: hypothetical protein JW772_01340 [Candidatus Diapherotrites archaeon]|nr:hypothetical protein [Candidatus Diapherotrites archaeon]